MFASENEKLAAVAMLLHGMKTEKIVRQLKSVTANANDIGVLKNVMKKGKQLRLLFNLEPEEIKNIISNLQLILSELTAEKKIT